MTELPLFLLLRNVREQFFTPCDVPEDREREDSNFSVENNGKMKGKPGLLCTVTKNVETGRKKAFSFVYPGSNSSSDFSL